jgi:catechol 2,3-dioxygenase-like lactoylglutathione lyase family enzyme
MVKKFDHVTIVVCDVDAAKRFFALLGFKEIKSVVISGKVMEDYMGVKGIDRFMTPQSKPFHARSWSVKQRQPTDKRGASTRRALVLRKAAWASLGSAFSTRGKSAAAARKDRAHLAEENPPSRERWAAGRFGSAGDGRPGPHVGCLCRSSATAIAAAAAVALPDCRTK